MYYVIRINLKMGTCGLFARTETLDNARIRVKEADLMLRSWGDKHSIFKKIE